MRKHSAYTWQEEGHSMALAESNHSGRGYKSCANKWNWGSPKHYDVRSS